GELRAVFAACEVHVETGGANVLGHQRSRPVPGAAAQLLPAGDPKGCASVFDGYRDARLGARGGAECAGSAFCDQCRDPRRPAAERELLAGGEQEAGHRRAPRANSDRGRTGASRRAMVYAWARSSPSTSAWNRPPTSRRASAAIREPSAGWSIRYASARPNDAGSPARASRPVFPERTISGTELTAVATTGIPQIMASTTAHGRPS